MVATKNKTAAKAAPAKKEMMDIVDKDDNVVGQMSREDIMAKGERFRAVHIYLVNDDDTILVQWRKLTKDTSPRMYTASAAGWVLAGETYEQAAIRELKEELGATKVKLKEMGKIQIKSGRKCHVTVFAGVWNGEPEGWEEEADAIDYWNQDEAEFMLQRFPYLLSPSFAQSLKLFIKLTK